jgi:hypothetical protein
MEIAGIGSKGALSYSNIEIPQLEALVSVNASVAPSIAKVLLNAKTAREKARSTTGKEVVAMAHSAAAHNADVPQDNGFNSAFAMENTARDVSYPFFFSVQLI